MDSIQETQFDSIATRYWDKNGPFGALHAMNPLRISLTTRTTPCQGKRVLDFGCGGGLSSFSLAENGASVVGVDASKTMIEVAEQYSKNRDTGGGSIDFVHQPELDPRHPLLTAPFDLIVAFEVCEHFSREKAQQQLAALSTMLKPGGVLCLTTIDRTVASFLTSIVMAEYVLGMVPKGTHRYDYLKRPSEVTHMARASGLQATGLVWLHYSPLLGSWRGGGKKSLGGNYFISFSKD